MQIEKISISKIRPYWRNPRDNEAAIDAVKKSIADYGFNSPLIVDKKHVIIAGHTRYKALLQLGYDEVPCVVVDLPENKAKEYRIADNKTSEFATWDMASLIPELRELQNVGDFQAYFPDVSLEELIAETAGAGTTYTPPTEERIAKVEEQLATKFEEASSKTEYVKVTCPHCGEESFVDRSELNRQPSHTLD